MPNYIAVIHKDADSDYGVSFPDFPGCITAGSTVDEAKDMAHEALSLHVKGMLEDGDALPEPTTLEDIINDPDFTDVVAFFVIPVEDKQFKTVRVNITISENVLHIINRAAKKRHMSRSAFLAAAAQQYISSPENGLQR